MPLKQTLKIKGNVIERKYSNYNVYIEVMLFQEVWFIFGGAMLLFFCVYYVFPIVGLPGVLKQPLFVFLGHCCWFCLAAMASFSGMTKNSNFVKEVSSQFRKEDEIIVGCQLGKRSMMAATDLLASVSISMP
ncbi:unnamed protein product [Trifolium pratense]|uniref:Uncharacterized protein n=1 Tax=Trifolium pratense TaxID=57577 RepID=A0ACB0JT38_TRIPR|nr:unnamed protein product [Trifolium pratense]